ncbi:hypothetical protein [Bounagaea algeriensis]
MPAGEQPHSTELGARVLVGLLREEFDELFHEVGRQVLAARGAGERCAGAALFHVKTTGRGRMLFVDDLGTHPGLAAAGTVPHCWPSRNAAGRQRAALASSSIPGLPTGRRAASTTGRVRPPCTSRNPEGQS